MWSGQKRAARRRLKSTGGNIHDKKGARGAHWLRGGVGPQRGRRKHKGHRPHTRMERTCSGRFGPEPSITGPRNVANLFIQLGEEL